MRKALVFFFSLLLFWVGPGPALGAEYLLHLEEGIYNEREYREVTFLTGEPVILTGTVQRTHRAGRGSGYHTSLNYKLSDNTGSIKLNRNISFTSSEEKKLEEKQTVYVTSVDRISETVTIGKDRYTLKDYQFSKSTLVDNKPAVAYFSGNWSGRKTYVLGKDQATIAVETWGDTVGYDHAWGSTETQRVDGTIRFVGDMIKDKKSYSQEWSGTFQLHISFNRSRDLSYQPNEPTPISFAGGYLETIKEEGILRYESNLPQFDDEGFLKKGWSRKHESGSTRLATLPTQRRLPAPLFRDISGHWAEGPILELAGLEAFPARGEYFGPRLSMTGGEFARALARLSGMEIAQESQPTAVNPFERFNREPKEEISPFNDVRVDHPYYQEIKAISQVGVIKGTTPGKFDPGGVLTRAQAITALIRALGFEGLAPFNPSLTPFQDDRDIPYWARD
ncbi:MAG TPA: S-layer homology domain-containing protein, partial [Clostridia bacterium]|nr:S-layer homology domain-containing protein [Clostridia bacterium]